MGEPHPRSSGLSRMGLILFIISNSFYFSNKLPEQYNFFILSISSFLIFIIYNIQSRGAILFLFILFFLILLTYNFKDIKQRLTYLIFIILVPILMFVSYPAFKSFIKLDTKSVIEKKTSLKTNSIIRGGFTEIFSIDDKLPSKEKIDSISSNRLSAWDYLIQVFFYRENQ